MRPGVSTAPSRGCWVRGISPWSIGAPPNPSAWITQVAMNLARDALRHRKMAHGKEPNVIVHSNRHSRKPQTIGPNRTKSATMPCG